MPFVLSRDEGRRQVLTELSKYGSAVCNRLYVITASSPLSRRTGRLSGFWTAVSCTLQAGGSNSLFTVLVLASTLPGFELLTIY